MSLSTDEIIKLATFDADHFTKNARYGAIVDFTAKPSQHRFFVVDIEEQTIVYSGYTSHGSGSGPLNGKNLKFSNEPNSHKSSSGRMKVAEEYIGKHGRSCRLDGLEPGVNDNVRRRTIVLHPVDCLKPEVVNRAAYPCRSWGCFMLDPNVSDRIINWLKDGSILQAVIE